MMFQDWSDDEWKEFDEYFEQFNVNEMSDDLKIVKAIGLAAKSGMYFETSDQHILH